MDNKKLIQKDLIRMIVGDARGAVGISLCAIGVDLGIFDDLAQKGPTTSQELADRMKLDERYLKEWRLDMFSLGYLDFDKVSRKISLKVKEYCDLFGFKTVKRIETDHPLNSVFEIRQLSF